MAQPELAQLETAFAEDFPIEALPPSDGAPLGQLAVMLDPDTQGRERAVYLLLVPPINDEDLYGLQFFAPLPFTVAGSNFGDLARLLLLLNTSVPLIGFGLSEESGFVFFRCIFPVAQDRALDPAEALHTTWMVFSLLDRFSDIIEAVATGRANYSHAHSAVQDILSSLDVEMPRRLISGSHRL